MGLSVVVGLIGFLVLAPEEPAPEAAPVPPIQPNTLIRIDPASMEIEDRHELSAYPKGVVFSAGLVWILEEGILEVFDPATSEIIGRTGFGFEPCYIAVTSSGVVVGDCEHHQLYRVDTDLEVNEMDPGPLVRRHFFAVIETVGGLWVLAGYD